MKNLLLFFPLIFPLFLYGQQTVNLQEIGQLNSLLDQTSGLQYHYNTISKSFECWSHPDSNEPNTFYSFTMNNPAAITRTVTFGVNQDWEDTAIDDYGNFYVGDIGSQAYAGSGGIYTIYKIPNPNTFTGSTPPTVDEINFNIPDDGGVTDVFNDSEAMIELNGNIYIFSKNLKGGGTASYPDSETHVLRFPASPSVQAHIPDIIGSFTVELDPTYYKITGADISPDKSTLVLLSQARLWIFSNFTGDDFFNGDVQYVEFGNFPTSQKEAVSFINNHEVIISQEANEKLFYLDISPFINTAVLDCNKIRNSDFKNNSTYGWYKWQSSDANASFNVINEAAEVQITNPGNNASDVTLNQRGYVLVKDSTYRISYTAYAEQSRPITVILSAYNGSNQHLYVQQNITTTATSYSHEFTMTDPTDFNARIIFGLGNQQAHKVFIDNVQIQNVNCTSCTDEELLLGNTFNQINTSPIPNWTAYDGGAATMSAGINQWGVAHLNVTNGGVNDWDVQLWQDNLSLEENKVYEIKAKIRADADRSVKLIIRNTASPVFYFEKTFEITLDFEVYTYAFISDIFDSDVRFSLLAGGEDEDVYIDSFSLKEKCGGLANSCVDYKSFVSSSSMPTGLQEADVGVNSNSQITNGNSVDFEAGKTITLIEGFQVRPDAEFSAKINGCRTGIVDVATRDAEEIIQTSDTNPDDSGN